MKRAVKMYSIISFLILCAGVVQAEDVVKNFTLKTIEGEVLEFSALKGTPLVVNIGSHW